MYFLLMLFSRRGQRGENDNSQSSYPPYPAEECAHGRTSEDVVNSRANGQLPSLGADGENIAPPQDASNSINRTENQATPDAEAEGWIGSEAPQHATQSGLNEQHSNKIPSPVPLIQGKLYLIPINLLI